MLCNNYISSKPSPTTRLISSPTDRSVQSIIKTTVRYAHMNAGAAKNEMADVIGKMIHAG
jgi:hypothetical protein